VKLCFDRRVVIGLAAVGLGALLISPGLAAGLVPLLIVAVCPLSMLFMMRGMSPGDSCSTDAAIDERHMQLSERDEAGLQAELRLLKAQQAAQAANRDQV
jgi:hypothetical protein